MFQTKNMHSFRTHFSHRWRKWFELITQIRFSRNRTDTWVQSISADTTPSNEDWWTQCGVRLPEQPECTRNQHHSLNMRDVKWNGTREKLEKNYIQSFTAWPDKVIQHDSMHHRLWCKGLIIKKIEKWIEEKQIAACAVHNMMCPCTCADMYLTP